MCRWSRSLACPCCRSCRTARHSQAALTPASGAEQIAGVRVALERKLLEIFLDRLRNQPFADEVEREERIRSVQNRIVDLLDSWIKVFDGYHAEGVRVQYQKHELTGPKPLLREMLEQTFDTEEQAKFRVNRSLRDVEPDVNLFLRDLGSNRYVEAEE